MEEIKTQAVEEKTTEPTEKVENYVEKVETEKKEETLTKSQVNEIVKERLAKAKKGYPSEEELKQFNDWKESQKTEAEKQAEREKEYLAKDKEIDNLKKDLLISKSNINSEYEKFVKFSVGEMEGNFEDNLNKFLTENPKYLKNYEEPTKNIDLGGNHSNQGTPNLDKMSYEEYKEFRKNN